MVVYKSYRPITESDFGTLLRARTIYVAGLESFQINPSMT